MVAMGRLEAADFEEPDGRVEERRVELFHVVSVGPHPVARGQALSSGRSGVVSEAKCVQPWIGI